MDTTNSQSTDLVSDLDRLLGMVDLSSPVAAAASLDDVAALTSIKSATTLEDLSPTMRAQALESGRMAFRDALEAGATLVEARGVAVAIAETTLDMLASEAAGIPAIATSIEPAPKSQGKRGVEICEAGKTRSQRDVDALRAKGFAMAEPIYDRGTMVVRLGVDNARKARAEYDAMPLVSENCDKLAAKIRSENRRMVEVLARDIRMERDGKVVLGASGAHAVTENGFASMVARLGYNGAQYLTACPTALRAHNVNEQRRIIQAAENMAQQDAIDAGWLEQKIRIPEPKRLAARVRDGRGGRQVFAFVSPQYPAFDGDLVAEAFKQAMPSDARGTVRYDADTTGTRLEALFHSTVAPEHFVAGEVFRTGIRVRANDSGDGSIVVRAVAFQNLCLNLIVIDRACREIARIRHVGSIEKLANEFAKAMAKAKAAIGPFMKQWGYACDEDIVGMLRAGGAKLPDSNEQIMRGIFAGLLKNRAVRFPRTVGKGKAAVVDSLISAWRKDDSGAVQRHHGITRAAVVNAITRAAQEWIDALDPWATDALELDAAKLLWGTTGDRPAPLAFVDLDAVAEETEIVQAQQSLMT